MIKYYLFYFFVNKNNLFIILFECWEHNKINIFIIINNIEIIYFISLID